MRQKIVPQGEIDALTREELAEELGRAFAFARDLPIWLRPEESGDSSSAGNVDIDVYTVVPGFEFTLTRLLVEAEGRDAGNPFQGALCFVEVRRSGVQIDFLNCVAGGPPPNGAIPAVFSNSITSGPRLVNGEVLQVIVRAGPPSVSILARAEGLLRRAK